MYIPDMADVEHRILEGAGTPSPSCGNVSSSVHIGLHKGLNFVDALCFLDFACLCLKYWTGLKFWGLAEDIWVNFSLICSMSEKEDHFVFACLDIYVSVNMGKQENCILGSKT